MPADSQNLFPLFVDTDDDIFSLLDEVIGQVQSELTIKTPGENMNVRTVVNMLTMENFFSAGSLLYQMGYKKQSRFHWIR